jgi:hypothetical protein
MLNNVKSSFESSGDAVRLAVVMQLRRTMPEFAAEWDDAPQSLAVFN